MPDGAQCDFDTSRFDDQMFDTLTQYSEVCGWKIPHHSAKSMSDILANGAVDKHSSLKIDLEIKPNEKIILSSPVFPPPPKYNNDKASPFFESCKVMSIYLTFYFLFHITCLMNQSVKHIKHYRLDLQIRVDYGTSRPPSTLTNGDMHWQIHYVNDVSRPIRNDKTIDVEHLKITDTKRWETRLTNINYR